MITLLTKDNHKLSKPLSNGLFRSVYWHEYKRKCENKNSTNEYRCFLESNLVGVNRFFVLVYSNTDDAKRYKTQRYYLPKGVIKTYNDDVITSSSLEKTFIKNPLNMI